MKKHLRLLIVCAVALAGMSCCVFAIGYRPSVMVGAESDGSNMLYTLKSQMINLEPSEEAGLRELFTFTLGYQDKAGNEPHIGFCLANAPSGLVDREIDNIEVLNFKWNYGLHDIRLGAIGYEKGYMLRLFESRESKRLGQTSQSQHVFAKPYIADLRVAFGFSSEYDQLEKPVARNQKWYISPSISLGFTSYLPYLNVYARLRCGLNKSSLVAEAMLPFDRKWNVCAKVFYNADYYYSFESARDNAFLKSFGVGLAWVP